MESKIDGECLSQADEEYASANSGSDSDEEFQVQVRDRRLSVTKRRDMLGSTRGDEGDDHTNLRDMLEGKRKCGLEEISPETLRTFIDSFGRRPLHLCLLRGNLTLGAYILERSLWHPLEQRQRTKLDKLRRISFENERMCFFSGKEECRRLAKLDREAVCRQTQYLAECKLLQHLSKQDRNGWTALHYAAQNGHGAMELLLEGRYMDRDLLYQGSNQPFNSDTGQLLEHGYTSQGVPIVTRKKLKSNRANLVNTQDSTGCTPLHIASANGNVCAITCLLRWDAQIHIANLDGETAIDVSNDRVVRKMLSGNLTGIAERVCERDSDEDAHAALRSLRTLLDCGEDVNGRFGLLQQCALHKACEKGEEMLVRFLVDEMDADLAIIDAAGWTALHYCAKHSSNSHRACADILIRKGVKIDAKSNSGLTALHLAATGAHTNENLETSSAELDVYSQVEIRARKENNAKLMVGLLIRNGASLDIRDNNSYSPLMLAARKGCCITAYELIQSGCDLYAKDSKSWNVLHIACFYQKLEMVHLLSYVDAGSYQLKTSRNMQGKLPYDLCKSSRFRDALTTIWEHARNGSIDGLRKALKQPCIFSEHPWRASSHEILNYRTYRDGYTPLYAAVEGQRKQKNTSSWRNRAVDSESAVKYLLGQHGILVNACDKDRCSPLMCAAQNNKFRIVKLLLQNGADPGMTDLAGNTAAHYAYAFDSTKIVDLLISPGETISNHNGQSPLMVSGLGRRIRPKRTVVLKNSPCSDESDEIETSDNEEESKNDTCDKQEEPLIPEQAQDSDSEREEEETSKTLKEIAESENGKISKPARPPGRTKTANTLKEIALSEDSKPSKPVRPVRSKPTAPPARNTMRPAPPSRKKSSTQSVLQKIAKET